MTSPTTPQVAVRRQQEVRARLQEQSLVWARDIASGRLRYIMELREHERGGACGCQCISCNQRLVAVNAAKSGWARRPHFRHESGAETHDCRFFPRARLNQAKFYNFHGHEESPRWDRKIPGTQ